MNKLKTCIIGGLLTIGAVGGLVTKNRHITNTNKELDRLYKLADSEINKNGEVSKETAARIKELESKIKTVKK